MDIKREITVIFINNSTSDLPLYAQYPDQLAPQDAFITLDLRDGEIDADYCSGRSNGVSMEVWGNVVIRFPINSCLTANSILNIINVFKDELEALYNESDTEINFNGNEVGFPLDGDKENWQQTIYCLKEKIESYSVGLSVNIADNDTFTDAITLTPSLNDLSEYASNVIDDIKSEYVIDSVMDDLFYVEKLIVEMYAQNTESLNKNAMLMLINTQIKQAMILMILIKMTLPLR